MLFSVRQVAARYGVSAKTVRRWLREGKVEAVRLPGGWRVDERSLQVFGYSGRNDNERDDGHDRGC